MKLKLKYLNNNKIINYKNDKINKKLIKS